MLGISAATLAVWGLRLSVAAPIVAVTLIGLFRLGLTDFRLPIYGLVIAVLAAMIALILNALALIAGLGGDGAHMQKAIIGLVLALIVLYAPINTLRKGSGVPAIHDISTDLDNPPLYEVVGSRRADTDNSLAIDKKVQAQQKAHYPALAPLQMAGEPGDNFAKALAAAEAMGWEIVATNADKGHIEAIATTTLFGFKDDVVIRLSADLGSENGGGTRLDMRSASRVGLSDLGANAARIQAYLNSLK